MSLPAVAPPTSLHQVLGPAEPGQESVPQLSPGSLGGKSAEGAFLESLPPGYLPTQHPVTTPGGLGPCVGVSWPVLGSGWFPRGACLTAHSDSRPFVAPCAGGRVSTGGVPPAALGPLVCGVFALRSRRGAEVAMHPWLCPTSPRCVYLGSPLLPPCSPVSPSAGRVSGACRSRGEGACIWMDGRSSHQPPRHLQEYMAIPLVLRLRGELVTAPHPAEKRLGHGVGLTRAHRLPVRRGWPSGAAGRSENGAGSHCVCQPGWGPPASKALAGGQGARPGGRRWGEVRGQGQGQCAVQGSEGRIRPSWLCRWCCFSFYAPSSPHTT